MRHQSNLATKWDVHLSSLVPKDMSRAAALTTLSLRRAATSYRAPLAKASLTSTTTTTIPSVSAAAVSRLRTSHHHLFSTSATSNNKMKAVIIKDGKGPADSLYIGEIETPSPGKNELLVKNKVGTQPGTH